MGDGKYRVYNGLNQLYRVYNGSSDAGILLQEFSYHPLEERVLVKKTYNSSGNLTETVYYWSKNFVTVVNLSGTYNFTYVYHNGELIAQSVNGVKTFFHNDIKGSVVAVSNASGAVIENTSYSPLGEVLTGGNQTRYDYEGKESDSVIGDTDFNARRYKPDLGIFEQPDTLIQNVYDPQSLNRYMFERGNPYKNKDETGHFWQIPVISGILFALYGGIGETVTQITITGRVYSWQRIASATGTNFVIGAAIGGIGLIPYVGIPLAGVALYVYAIYSDVSTAESVKAAQEQKALDKLQEEEKEKTEEGETMKTMTEVNPPVDYNKLSSFESRTQAALRRIILGEGDLMDYSLANRNPDIYWAVYNPDIGKWEPPPPKPIPTPNPMP